MQTLNKTSNNVTQMDETQINNNDQSFEKFRIQNNMVREEEKKEQVQVDIVKI